MKQEILLNGKVYIAEPVNFIVGAEDTDLFENQLYYGDLTMLNPDKTENNMSASASLPDGFYETGEYDPLYVFNAARVSFTDNIGKFTRIGDMCTVLIDVKELNTDLASVGFNIKLPFKALSSSYLYSFSRYSLGVGSTDVPNIVPDIKAGSTAFVFRTLNGSAPTTVFTTPTSGFVLAITYKVDLTEVNNEPQG